MIIECSVESTPKLSGVSNTLRLNRIVFGANIALLILVVILFIPATKCNLGQKRSEGSMLWLVARLYLSPALIAFSLLGIVGFLKDLMYFRSIGRYLILLLIHFLAVVLIGAFSLFCLKEVEITEKSIIDQQTGETQEKKRKGAPWGKEFIISMVVGLLLDLGLFYTGYWSMPKDLLEVQTQTEENVSKEKSTDGKIARLVEQRQEESAEEEATEEIEL